MMRYRLRTLLILLAVGPPVVWAGCHIAKTIIHAREIAALEAAIEAYKHGNGDYPTTQHP